MNNRRFITLILTIPLTAGLLIASCVHAAWAGDTERCLQRCIARCDTVDSWCIRSCVRKCEPAAPTYRVPGGCVTITDARGSATRCTYSPAQLERLRREGK